MSGNPGDANRNSDVGKLEAFFAPHGNVDSGKFERDPATRTSKTAIDQIEMSNETIGPGAAVKRQAAPELVAEVVRCVRELSSKAVISAQEREFVNEQAALVSEQMMRTWAGQRYKGRKQLRPCCVGLALAIALDVAHQMSLAGESLSAGRDKHPHVG